MFHVVVQTEVRYAMLLSGLLHVVVLAELCYVMLRTKMLQILALAEFCCAFSLKLKQCWFCLISESIGDKTNHACFQ